jgi:glycosyltransferase involved in cell wall biosynthesis
VRFSVILSTYNEPASLEKVLWAYAGQTYRDFELLIADDGSGPATADLVQRVSREAELPIRHIWQEDRGFRKCQILNRAILASTGDYLIFSDGDCVPRDDFVETHVRLRKPGRFLSGGALRLPRPLCDRMSLDDVRSDRVTQLDWLVEGGWRPGHRVFRLTRNRRLATWLDRVTTTKAAWNGGNASVWRDAIFEVNGFDHEMGYKGQDRAFGNRLQHLGLRGLQVRHRAVVVHLDHDRPWATPEAFESSHKIRRRILSDREVRARRGIAELSELEPGSELTYVATEATSSAEG